MKKVYMKKEEFKALSGLLKACKKDGRAILHNFLIEDGAIHVTNGKILIRLNKEERGNALKDFEPGCYEVLKTETPSRFSPDIEVFINKIGGSPPKMTEMLEAVKVGSKCTVPIFLNGTALGMTKAVIRLFETFKQAYSVELLGYLSPLKHEFMASVPIPADRPGGGAVRLSNDAVTALIMPFDLTAKG